MAHQVTAYNRDQPMQSYEIIDTDGLEAVCNGGGGPLGHPRVYLHIDPDEGQITCPYCSRTYRLSASATPRAAHG